MAPWYEDGLRFECSRCGRCCTGHGYVWMTRSDIERLADELEIDVDEVGRRYLRRVGGRLSLVERQDGDCVFWSSTEGCTVYDARPGQCRTFPFWPANLRDEGSWAAVGGACPGVGEGRLYSLGEIETLAAGGGRTGGDGDG